ncbi:hypothetical protein L917_02681 [Phytophthora nicotianae]|uniref:Transposase IS30-like HTH domain-containing protein n=1 Tax=Phytophthora nicotianae TaxID=4792 RepID=W2HI15_PHYNI|nr:hypothetical protein L915_02773 [Phytophthora nicotianae]ETM00609.1 hypothetical protein L917_02681 [Phytophthora nicotianae]
MPRKKKLRPSLKKPRLNEHERGRYQGLHAAGVSARDIAVLTERSRDTVVRFVAPPLPPTKLKRPGPSTTLTIRETRRLVREVSEGNLWAAKLKAEVKLSVSVRTIQRTLSRVDRLVFSSPSRI